MHSITIGIVCHDTSLQLVTQCINSLVVELTRSIASESVNNAEIVMLDNSEKQSYGFLLDQLVADSKEYASIRLSVVHTKNKGFGAGHNKISASCISDFYLVANPDLMFHEGSISSALDSLEDESISAVMPVIENSDGILQSHQLQNFGAISIAFRTLLRPLWNGVQMRMVPEAKGELYCSENVAVFSGCCMFYRRRFFEKLGGFDEKFFLYFEDYDLSLRTLKESMIMVNPGFRISHYGGGASRKGIWHIKMFLRSAITFFVRYPKYIFS
ncbi:glycosyltransferase [Microbulbifer agarilyticus]